MGKCHSLLFALCIIFCLPLTPAHAEDDCLQNFLVVDRYESFDLSGPGIEIRLPSSNSHGNFLSAAKFHATSDGKNNLEIFFDFVLPGAQVSLPYNVYKLELSFSGDDPQKDFSFLIDLTDACTGPGRSIYPGQVLRLPKQILPFQQDDAAQGAKRVHVKIWGHL